MKRTIEINDTLDENVESAIDSVKTELMDFLEANPDQDELPCLNNDLDYSGAIHEIIDGAVPVYTYNQKCLYFLYESELDEAFDNAGISTRDEAKDNYIGMALYCYISDKVNEWYNDEAPSLFEEWNNERTFTSVICKEDGSAHITSFSGDSVVIPYELLNTEDFDLEDHLKGIGFMPKHGRLEQGE